MDHLHTLNDLTPKVRCDGRNGVDPDLIFGIESTLFLDKNVQIQDPSHVDEVQTLTLYRGSTLDGLKTHDHHDGHVHEYTQEHHSSSESQALEASIPKGSLVKCLTTIGKESVWRLKGFIRIREEVDVEQVYILNWAFGRYELTRSNVSALERSCSAKFTVMGERGEVRRAIEPFCRGLELSIV